MVINFLNIRINVYFIRQIFWVYSKSILYLIEKRVIWVVHKCDIRLKWIDLNNRMFYVFSVFLLDGIFLLT